METVSRNTFFMKPKDGGINVISFPLKAQALRLAGMASVLNFPDDSSFFMPKYFVGRRFSCLRTEWLSLCDNSAPSAVFPTSFLRGLFGYLAKGG